ncbi:MAG: O-acetyl-ADP-ribose deacetylase [Campylobacterota bacterium]|nr:O-acetyl-ADP-ribose deacetylase [Campylobacterota bacterium]
MIQLSPKIYAKVSDITQEKVCAIVNAANSSLMGGGGVDGAIHRAGGSEILRACKRIRQSDYPDGLPTGEAVATTAGELPSKYVIHTVGPIYRHCGDRCASLLSSCYKSSMEEAARVGCDSIAFPAISTGIYGYPKNEAAEIALNTVRALQLRHAITVIFVFHSEEDLNTFLTK